MEPIRTSSPQPGTDETDNSSCMQLAQISAQIDSAKLTEAMSTVSLDTEQAESTSLLQPKYDTGDVLGLKKSLRFSQEESTVFYYTAEAEAEKCTAISQTSSKNPELGEHIVLLTDQECESIEYMQKLCLADKNKNSLQTTIQKHTILYHQNPQKLLMVSEYRLGELFFLGVEEKHTQPLPKDQYFSHDFLISYIESNIEMIQNHTASIHRPRDLSSQGIYLAFEIELESIEEQLVLFKERYQSVNTYVTNFIRNQKRRQRSIAQFLAVKENLLLPWLDKTCPDADHETEETTLPGDAHERNNGDHNIPGLKEAQEESLTDIKTVIAELEKEYTDRALFLVDIHQAFTAEHNTLKAILNAIKSSRMPYETSIKHIENAITDTSSALYAKKSKHNEEDTEKYNRLCDQQYAIIAENSALTTHQSAVKQATQLIKTLMDRNKTFIHDVAEKQRQQEKNLFINRKVSDSLKINSRQPQYTADALLIKQRAREYFDKKVTEVRISTERKRYILSKIESFDSCLEGIGETFMGKKGKMATIRQLTNDFDNAIQGLDRLVQTVQEDMAEDDA